MRSVDLICRSRTCGIVFTMKPAPLVTGDGMAVPPELQVRGEDLRL